MITRCFYLPLCLVVMLCTGISASAQRFSCGVDIAAGYNWRSITVNSSDPVVLDVKKRTHDNVDRPAISYKIGMDARYKLTSSSFLRGTLSLLNYREKQKWPGYVKDEGWVHPTHVPSRKVIHNYHYLQAGIGYQQVWGRHRKMFAAAMLNIELPLYDVFTYKEGHVEDIRLVHRRTETKNNPQTTLSPELVLGRNFLVPGFSFSVYTSGQYFLNPLFNTGPIKEHPILGHIGISIPLYP